MAAFSFKDEMNEKLVKLKALLESGTLLRRETFPLEDIDEALDLRDDISFETEWLRVHDALGERPPVSKEDLAVIDEIREMAYLSTYGHTDDPDLSAFVSDDFGLIGTAIAAGFWDPWLCGVWQQYKSGRFPFRAIERIEGDLEIP